MTLTIVSGYWIVKNKHDMKYLEWFKNSLKIQCPYVFFGDAESIAIIKPFREGYPTHYIECKLEDFYCYKYCDRINVDPRHCPSPELAMIWNEKLFLMQKVAALNPFQSEFFMWVDAGICVYRDTLPPTGPFPNARKLAMLPKDKFIFTSSNHTSFHIEYLGKPNDHFIAGTAYLMHHSILNRVVELFKGILEKYSTKDAIITDQILLTYMYAENPGLFLQIGHGYGAIVPILY